MATTVDNLRVDHHVTLLRDVCDPAGNALKAGATGVIRHLSFDDLRMEVHLGIERAEGSVHFVLPIRVQNGPRLGHYKEYFELGDYAPLPGERLRPVTTEQGMIVPPPLPAEHTTPGSDRPVLGDPAGEQRPPTWWNEARQMEADDRCAEAERKILDAVPHIGAAASVAEMYAERMRRFQRAGDEARAVEAFKKAVDWMGSYASSATSGGEGVALSYERDQFHAALVREFGYDPLARQRDQPASDPPKQP